MAVTAKGDPADEGRHQSGPDPGWHEGWTFDFWLADRELGGGVGLVLWPQVGRAWYWANLVRPGAPLVHLADLEVVMPRHGLEIRAEGLWAEHICEAPYEQWTVANEAYAVALDDPEEALRRAHGDPVAVAFDLEWYAASPPGPLRVDGAVGYRQHGEVHGAIEVAGGPLRLEAASTRAHWWGSSLPWPRAATAPTGVRAPVRLGLPTGDALVLERVLTPSGWWEGLARR